MCQTLFAGVSPASFQKADESNDDWETDPDFVNDVTEEEQRWGSKTVEGSGRTGGAIEYVKLKGITSLTRS